MIYTEILRYGNVVCVQDSYGFLYAQYPDGTREPINRKTDILPTTCPVRSFSKYGRKRKNQR
jgi:hypothetical protein